MEIDKLLFIIKAVLPMTAGWKPQTGIPHQANVPAAPEQANRRQYTMSPAAIRERQDNAARRRKMKGEPPAPRVKKPTEQEYTQRWRKAWTDLSQKLGKHTVMPVTDIAAVQPKQAQAVMKKLTAMGASPAEMRKRMIDLYRSANQPHVIKQGARAGQTETPEEAKKRLAAWDNWYPNANAFAQRMADMGGISQNQAAAIVAVLSPQMEWGYNQIAARDTINILSQNPEVTLDKKHTAAIKKEFGIDLENYDGEDKNFTGKNVTGTRKLSELPYDIVPMVSPTYNRETGKQVAKEDRDKQKSTHEGAKKGMMALLVESRAMTAEGRTKAIRAFRGEDIDSVLGEGPKVRSFYDNIVDPHNEITKQITANLPVTIDVHMARAMFGWNTQKKAAEKMLGTTGAYQVIAKQVENMAGHLNMAPSALQARLWMEQRYQHSREERREFTNELNKQKKVEAPKNVKPKK